MKKKYIKPQMMVAEIPMGLQLLAGSTPGYGGGGSGDPQAPEFEEGWIEKEY